MATLEDRRRNHQPFANVWDPTLMMKSLAGFRKIYGTATAKAIRDNMRLHGWLDCQTLDSHPAFAESVIKLACLAGADGIVIQLVPFEHAKHGLSLAEVN